MHLAQLNIATAKFELDDSRMDYFMNNLDYINGIAEKTDGFIWRMKDDSGNAMDLKFFDNPLLVANMSVWRDSDALKEFMFKSDHLEFLQRKDEWFEKMPEANYVMWWIEEGHIPTMEEAMERLEYLRKHGETPSAFSFRSKYAKQPPAELFDEAE